MKDNKQKKALWRDNSGEFNWAMIAVIALAAIFFYNVFTANVVIPQKDLKVKQETVQNNWATDNGAIE